MSGPNLTPALASRAPKSAVELQIVIDLVFAELQPSSDVILRVPLERTIAENRGVILARSREMLDIFGQTIDYEIPRKIRELVHYGDQTFAFTSDAASKKAIRTRTTDVVIVSPTGVVGSCDAGIDW